MVVAAINKIPEKCTVLIIGGGPAGSSAATDLAKSGIDVVVLERAVFPRNQVGESLIPHFWKFTDALGVSGKIQQQGFIEKAGGITVWNNKVRQILFSEYGYQRPGLHIERDIFDDLLLSHSQDVGAQVFHQVVVKRIDFSNVDQPVVFYFNKANGESKEASIRCQYVVDASGHSTLLANYFGTRKNISSNMNFLSLWGYYKNSRFLGVDRKSHAVDEINSVKPVTFVNSYKEGWLWHIVLRQSTSVGLIMPTDQFKAVEPDQREAYFKHACQDIPQVKKLLETAEFIQGSLQFRPNYSYYCEKICGENYYCIGDAAAFTDPIFSHGVQNAFYNAAVSCVAIKASLKNKKNRLRYSQLCESRMQQFYGFSRALALGDYGVHGVDRNLVKALMKTLSVLELELILVASEMTNRSENFRQLAHEAGVWENILSSETNQSYDSIESLVL
jgi:flavin-dependent dehydrogenase